MSRSTSRVLAMLELFQAHGGLAGSELARRLKVDPRTVRRYVVTLVTWRFRWPRSRAHSRFRCC